MSEEAGHSVSAAGVTQAALVQRYEALVAADQVLAAAVTDAHAVTVEALGRLDAIGAEIEDAVAQQHLLALDTAAGARQFQRFLLDKHHDIIAVVTEATAHADSGLVGLQALADQYRTDAETAG